MTSTTIIVIVVAAIFGLLAMIHRGYRRRLEERAEEYRKAAMLRGWTLEWDLKDFHYSGSAEGIHWTLVIPRRGDNRKQTPPAKWQTQSARSDEPIIVWPRQGVHVMRVDVPDFVRNLVLLPISRVIGVDTSVLAAARQDERLQDALGDTMIIVGLVTADGMRVIYPAKGESPEAVEPMIRLCVKLARTQSRQGVFEDV